MSIDRLAHALDTANKKLPSGSSDVELGQWKRLSPFIDDNSNNFGKIDSPGVAVDMVLTFMDDDITNALLARMVGMLTGKPVLSTSTRAYRSIWRKKNNRRVTVPSYSRPAVVQASPEPAPLKITIDDYKALQGVADAFPAIVRLIDEASSLDQLRSWFRAIK